MGLVACLVMLLVLCGISGMSCYAIGVVWDQWHVLWCDWCCEISGMFCGAIGVVRSVACLVVLLVLCGIGGMSCGAIGVVWD